MAKPAALGYVPAMAEETRPGIGPVVDCNVHLWDQRDNPVFWLSDRTLVRDIAIGDMFDDLGMVVAKVRAAHAEWLKDALHSEFAQ